MEWVIALLTAQLAIFAGIFVQLGRVIEITAGLKERVEKLEKGRRIHV